MKTDKLTPGWVINGIYPHQTTDNIIECANDKLTFSVYTFHWPIESRISYEVKTIRCIDNKILYEVKIDF